MEKLETREQSQRKKDVSDWFLKKERQRRGGEAQEIDSNGAVTQRPYPLPTGPTLTISNPNLLFSFILNSIIL